MSFELVIKNNKMEYKQGKDGSYKYKDVDDIRTYDSLAEALAEFLYSVNDNYNEDRVTLKFIPSKKKKKK